MFKKNDLFYFSPTLSQSLSLYIYIYIYIYLSIYLSPPSSLSLFFSIILPICFSILSNKLLFSSFCKCIVSPCLSGYSTWFAPFLFCQTSSSSFLSLSLSSSLSPSFPPSLSLSFPPSLLPSLPFSICPSKLLLWMCFRAVDVEDDRLHCRLPICFQILYIYIT